MKTQTGFTIIELMIVVALAAVLLTIGIPGFQEMVQDNRRASATVEMISAIQIARSEAVKLNAPMTLCPSSDGSSCSGTAWETGWIAFIDDDLDDVDDAADGNGARDTGEDLVRTGSALGAIAISSTFTSLTYRPNGRMETSGGNTEAEFILCDGRGAGKGRAILIFRSGRPETSTTDLANNAITSCRTP
jgi:type IV fimbrial biogenesis protein FimT